MGLLLALRILFLGDKYGNCDSLYRWLCARDNFVDFTTDKITDIPKYYDIVISYGYSHIIPKKLISGAGGVPIVNLHISYLPYNRGADPNLWSHVEGTPKGVTIHYVDEGIDTGDIIVQKEVQFDENDTLKTSYTKLHSEIQELFKKNWYSIQIGRFGNKGIKQKSNGTFHLAKDKEKIKHLLIKNWDTPIRFLAQKSLP